MSRELFSDHVRKVEAQGHAVVISARPSQLLGIGTAGSGEFAAAIGADALAEIAS